MNPYERWDDWEWEKAIQEMSRERGTSPRNNLKGTRSRKKADWGGFLTYWSGGQRKTLLAALAFLTIFFSSHGTDTVSLAVHSFYKNNMNAGSLYASLNDMAKQAMGFESTPSIPVDAKMQGKFAAPVSGPVMAGFGLTDKEKGTVHEGIDVGSALGHPVVAPYDGVVVAVGVDPQLGNILKLDLGDGWTCILGNLGDIQVQKGQKVSMGEPVATVGLSAPLKKPWLHFELRKNDKPLNPIPYLIPPKN